MKARTIILIIAVPLLLVAFGVWFVAGGPLERLFAPDPVVLPAKADSYTATQLHADMLAHAHRTMVAPYRQVGVRRPSWDAAALKYLEANARYFSSQLDAPTRETLVAQGRTLVAKGCGDPMVLYCYGAALQDTGWDKEAETMLARAVIGFEAHAYPRTRAFFAPTRLCELALKYGRESEAKQWRDLAVAWVGQAAGEVQDAGRDQQVFLTLLAPRWDLLAGAAPGDLLAALEANPGAPAYLLAVVEGYVEMDEAWADRGGGWAKDVTEKQWQQFHAHLRSAAVSLTDAWNARPEFPQAPASMVRVTMGLSPEDAEEKEREWFSRAVTAQLDYAPAYTNLLWAWRPRWNGSHALMLEVGKAALNTGRFDTEVPRWYLQAVNDIWEDSEGKRDIWSKPEIHQNLVRMCKGYAMRGAPPVRNYYLTLLAYLSWRTDHYAEARRAFSALGSRAQRAALTDWGFDDNLAQVRTQSFALSGPAADLVEEADASLDPEATPEDKAEALKLYRQAAGRDRDPEAAAYLAYRIAELDSEARFMQSKWVDLVTTATFPLWDQELGQWQLLPDGSLVGTSDLKGLSLIKHQSYGRRVELEGDLEILRAPSPEAQRAVLMFDVEPGSSEPDAVDVEISPAASQVIVVRRSDESERGSGQAAMGKKLHFGVLLWGNTLTVSIDGNAVVYQARVGPFPEGRENGGLGFACHQSGPGVVYRLSNLRARLPTERPRPQPGGPGHVIGSHPGH